MICKVDYLNDSSEIELVELPRASERNIQSLAEEYPETIYFFDNLEDEGVTVSTNAMFDYQMNKKFIKEAIMKRIDELELGVYGISDTEQQIARLEKDLDQAKSDLVDLNKNRDALVDFLKREGMWDE